MFEVQSPTQHVSGWHASAAILTVTLAPAQPTPPQGDSQNVYTSLTFVYGEDAV
jgi:hypothetical protein